MRHSIRTRLAVFSTLLVGLVLCIAFVSNTFAAPVSPHISVKHTHAVTDVKGCASFTFSGSSFTESTKTIPNSAVLRVDDPPFVDDDAFWQATGDYTISVPVNKEGKFTATLTICDPFVTAPDHYAVSSVDNATGLPGNSVNLLVD